jgi:hypothetical protein
MSFFIGCLWYEYLTKVGGQGFFNIVRAPTWKDASNEHPRVFQSKQRILPDLVAKTRR